MGLGFRLEHRQDLRHEQKLEQAHSLKHSLELKIALDLRLALLPLPPPIHNAIRGMAGVEAAHATLLKAGEAGILVGGLAEDLCRSDSTAAGFEKHKDVDVLVLPQGKSESKITFAEAGVDWWLPYTESVKLRSDAITSETFLNKTFFGNINDITLFYQIKVPSWSADLAPGLHILGVRDMRNLGYEQGIAAMTKGDVEISSDSLEEFEKKLAEKFNGKSIELSDAMKRIGIHELSDGAVEIFGLAREDKIALRTDRQLLQAPWVRFKDELFKMESVASEAGENGVLRRATYQLANSAASALIVELMPQSDGLSRILGGLMPESASNGIATGGGRRSSRQELAAFIDSGDLKIRFGAGEEPFIDWTRLPAPMQASVLDIVEAGRLHKV